MDATAFWEETNTQDVKFDGYGTSNEDPDSAPVLCREGQNTYRCCNGNLNFATAATSEDEYNGLHRKRVSRDPMSHRIIEKRRRDRMNNCLADLSHLIPANYLKKGRGRVEKTEIIEMAIRHMKHLQSHAFQHIESGDSSDQQQSPVDLCVEQTTTTPIVGEHYRLGYQECLSEVMHFLVEVEGFFAADPLCVQLINHLQKHCDNIFKGDRLNFPRTHQIETSSSSGSSYNRQQNGNNGPRGSSGTPDSSDSGRPDNKNQGLLGLTEEDDGGRSQLRDMLTSPSTLNVSRNVSRYKFKNNIKQRFSAEADRQHSKRRRYEQLDSNGQYEQQKPSGRYEQLNSNGHCEQLDRSRRYEQLDSSRRCEQLDLDRRNSTVPSCPASPKQQTLGVPIFALHSRGNFYIPLTLDSEMLAPHLGTLTSGSRDLVLHPVTISVNFQQGQAAQPQGPPLDMQLTHNCCKTKRDSILALPKWSVCVPDGV